jgi:hypothetical protein
MPEQFAPRQDTAAAAGSAKIARVSPAVIIVANRHRNTVLKGRFARVVIMVPFSTALRRDPDIDRY